MVKTFQILPSNSFEMYNTLELPIVSLMCKRTAEHNSVFTIINPPLLFSFLRLSQKSGTYCTLNLKRSTFFVSHISEIKCYLFFVQPVCLLNEVTCRSTHAVRNDQISPSIVWLVSTLLLTITGPWRDGSTPMFITALFITATGPVTDKQITKVWL